MSETVKRYDCSSGGAKFCQGCYTMEECEHGDYVQHEDYARLEQKLDRFQAVLEGAQYPNLDQLPWLTVEVCQTIGSTVAELTMKVQAERDAAMAECERLRVLMKEIRPTIPRDVLELWCADRDAALSAKP